MARRKKQEMASSPNGISVWENVLLQKQREEYLKECEETERKFAEEDEKKLDNSTPSDILSEETNGVQPDNCNEWGIVVEEDENDDKEREIQVLEAAIWERLSCSFDPTSPEWRQMRTHAGSMGNL